MSRSATFPLTNVEELCGGCITKCSLLLRPNWCAVHPVPSSTSLSTCAILRQLSASTSPSSCAREVATCFTFPRALRTGFKHLETIPRSSTRCPNLTPLNVPAEYAGMTHRLLSSGHLQIASSSNVIATILTLSHGAVD